MSLDTIIIMARDGSGDRTVNGHHDALTYACAEAARLDGTHIVVLYDFDGWQIVRADGYTVALTTSECADLGIEVSA